jgi:hypothetical protein
MKIIQMQKKDLDGDQTCDIISRICLFLMWENYFWFDANKYLI